MTAAAFKAGYADWKLIKTRKCVQIVFEVPIEDADAAYQALGGMPDAGTERWFGIARLDPSIVPPQQEEAAQPRPSPLPHPKTDGAPKSSAQIAGYLCTLGSFRAFLVETRDYYIGMDEESAADAVRYICGVDSRRDILPGTPAERKFQELVAEFRAWERVPV